MIWQASQMRSKRGIFFVRLKLINNKDSMATCDDNVLTRSSRGRIGNLIFRRWGQKTVVSAVPDYTDRKWSKAQKANRLRFRDAMAYARKALDDPEKQKYYQKKAKGMQTIWNVAVADYMKKPQIKEIDVHNYKGQKGNTIRVAARDNYRVAGVIVSIVDARGFEVESGMAVEMLSSNEWIYKAMEPNTSWQGGRIVVRVTDSPGNIVKTFRMV
jgi:hypothetical protein